MVYHLHIERKKFLRSLKPHLLGKKKFVYKKNQLIPFFSKMPVALAKERPVTLEIDNLQFQVFDADDIRKFSVCKITNPISFDCLGNSTREGNLLRHFSNVNHKTE